MPRILSSDSVLTRLAIDVICKVLERSGRPVRNKINKRLVEQHAHGNGQPREVDLLDPYYHWSTMDHLTGIQSDSRAHSGHGLYQGFGRRSNFCFISGAFRDVELDLTARLPTLSNESRRQTGIQVMVNGQKVGSMRVGTRWARMAINVSKERLGTGINRLTIVWPELSPDGDAATQYISERLKRGIPTNLEPVFGEIQSLVARS